MKISTFRLSISRVLLGLVILAILIILCIPIYTQHKITTNRHRAESALKHLASRMEEFYSLQGSFRHVTPEILVMNEIDRNPGYQLKILRSVNAHFTVSAIPVGFQKRKDTQCETLSLTDSGKRYITGTGSVSGCWGHQQSRARREAK